MMNTREAAEELGVSTNQVRWLIKNGRLEATKKESRHNQHGYEWHITKRAVLACTRSKDPTKGGWPPGKKRA